MSSLSGTTSGTDEAGPPYESGRGGLSGAAVAPKPLGQRPDVALLQRAQAGDRGAYGQVVVLYQDRLYNAVLRLVGDREEARELT